MTRGGLNPIELLFTFLMVEAEGIIFFDFMNRSIGFSILLSAINTAIEEII